MTVLAGPTALAAACGAVVMVLLLRGRRLGMRVTSDLKVAARPVSPLRNAAAISGEAICAPAFLGTAGMVLAYGVDMLWLPIGAAGGYVVLLALVTAPLRRSGVYTLSDFAEWRLGSCAVRHTVTLCVCFVGWFYLLPQFEGAGVTLRVVTGAPQWAGWLVVFLCVLGVLIYGGIRGGTVMQAYRFWLKLVAVALPAVVLVAVWRLRNGPDPMAAGLPGFPRTTTVDLDLDAAVQVPADTMIEVVGDLDHEHYDGDHVLLTAGRHVVSEGTRLVFQSGSAVPHAEWLPIHDGAGWAMPLTGGGEHPLFCLYSLLAGLLLGTMGLPHIVVRFYTNTSGRSARRTAALIPVLLSMFFVFPTLYGALGRLYTPELLMTGETDATVLLLPQRLVPGLYGTLISGVLAAGALTAFVSAACGIVVALACTISRRPLATGPIGGFRFGVVVALAVPMALLGRMAPLGSVGLVLTAFTVAASSLCPLLVLGIWWRRLTPAGACTGLVVGGGLGVAAALIQIIAGPRAGWPGALLAQPTLAVAPIGFLVMVVVSLATPKQVPVGVDRLMARLHVPEGVLAGPGEERSGVVR